MEKKVKPNIILIMTDQHRIDTLNCYGGKVCKTPHIDQLVDESLVFDNAYTVCPICSPARASIQTGVYPFKHGMLNNIYTVGNKYQELPDNQELLSRRLLKQGYSVGYTGKWHLGFGNKHYENPNEYRTLLNRFHYDEAFDYGNAIPSSLGYEGDDFPGHGGGGHDYPSYKEYLIQNGLSLDLANTVYVNGNRRAAEVISPIESTVSHFLVERSIHHIEKFSKRENPFFFTLNFWGPHEPYFAQSEFLDMYRDVTIEPWASFDESCEDKPSIHDLKRMKESDWKFYEQLLRHYYALTSEIDHQIGRLLTYLKDNNLYDNTVIIFSADHGESLGIHGGLMDKSIFMYDEILKVPLIIKSTGHNTSKHDERFANTCDLYSTILELSGLPRGEVQRDGKSLVPIMEDEVCEWRECVVAESSGIRNVLHTQRMIRKGNMKYIFNIGETDELYDLENDPSEMINLIKDMSFNDTLAEMRQLLYQWMKDHGDILYNQFAKFI